ncbi:MAG: cold-shock protein [Alistipes sp.]|nr:cold-shock protein [Alistipes sp.]
MTGRVKWFDNRKGYGFISGDDGVEIYVHFTALQGDGFRGLKHNQRVSYDVVATERNSQEARNVTILAK